MTCHAVKNGSNPDEPASEEKPRLQKRIVMFEGLPRILRRHLEEPVLAIGEGGQELLCFSRPKSMLAPLFPGRLANPEMMLCLVEAWEKSDDWRKIPFQVVMFADKLEVERTGRLDQLGLAICPRTGVEFSGEEKTVELFPFESYQRVTELDGYYATGDHESFCFGRIRNPGEHMDYMREHHPRPEMPEEWHADPGAVPKDEFAAHMAAVEAHQQIEDKMRVYPNRLLPSEVDDRKGRWRITVEFWPQETVDTEKSGRGGHNSDHRE